MASQADWTAVILALVGSGGLGTAVWKTYESYLKRTQWKQYIKYMDDAARILDILNETHQNMQCSRVLLMYTSNGGGVPQAITPIYATALFEVKDVDLEEVKSSFQNFLIDGAHIKMLRQVASGVPYDSSPENMEDGFLKKFYTEEGVVRARFMEVHRTKYRYYYLVIKWNDTDTIPGDRHIDVMTSVHVSELSNLIRSIPQR